jgi:hypothetical protein
VTWRSSNTGVAAINSAGVVTYRASGSTIITATAGSGANRATGSLFLTVRDTVPKLPVSTITVHTGSPVGTQFKVLPGDNFQFDDIVISGDKRGLVVEKDDAVTYRIRSESAERGRVMLNLQAVNNNVPIGIPFVLTVNVLTEPPRATVRIPTLNTFWMVASSPISITGTNLPKVERILISQDVARNFTINSPAEGEFTVTIRQVLRMPVVTRGDIEIHYEGFNEPFIISNFTIPIRATTPKLTLKPASQTINTQQGNLAHIEVVGGLVAENGVSFTTASPKFEDEDVFAVPNNAGNIITLQLDNYNEMSAQRFRPNLDIMLTGARMPISVRPTVSTAHGITNYRLSTSAVTLSRQFENQHQTVQIIPNHANACRNVTIETPVPIPEGITVVQRTDGSLHVTIDEKLAVPNTRGHIFIIRPDGNPNQAMRLTVRVTNNVPTVTVRADRGNINLINQGNTMRSYRPVIRGTASAILPENDAVRAIPATTGADHSGLFDVRWNFETGKVEVRTKPQITYRRGAAYRLRFEFDLEGGDNNKVRTGNITVRPAQSAVRHNIPRQTMYQSRTGTVHRQTIDLTQTSPSGARVETLQLKANPNSAYWYNFDENRQQLHIWIRDGSRVRLGRYNVTFSVTYEGQGVERNGSPRRIDLRVPVNVLR